MEGFDVSISFGKSERDNPNLHDEMEILKEWQQILEDRYTHRFVILSNSSDYTTLQPEGCLDILRLKYGNKVKWIKLFITSNIAKNFKDDVRFKDEKKKTSAYWKSTLESKDISVYFDILDDAFDWLIQNQ